MKKSNRVVSFLLALTLVTGLMPADAFTFTAFATGQSGKPVDGTLTDGEVFPTEVSENFRIPGIVNFKGDLVASADARWDYEKDGGGMDLVVSTSTDGGDTWSYTFAGYLDDSKEGKNVWDPDASTLMDPVIITDGNTLYLLADMYPAGYSISSSSTTNTFSDTNIGFDANGNLLLSKDGRSSYGYYLKDGKIYSTDGVEESGYTVKGSFDLYKNGTYVTNLFFSDSPYQVRATSYICMMSSTDGKTWSEPTLLNVKPSGVAWMVLGPGSGLVTQDGYIAFTAYDGSNIYLIYGKDGDWNTVRTSAATNESSIIELNDGTIRAFVKRGGNNTIAYVDFTKNNDGSYSATALVDTGVNNFSQCMVSSLHYSRTLEGKEVVLVCCPAKPGSGAWNGRFNGKIFVFTLDENNAMTLVNSHALNGETEFFAYSNMAEMDDGTIAVLYEDDCISYSAGNYTGTRSHITFTTVDLEEVLGKTFDAVTLTDDNTDISVTAPDLSHMEIIKLAESQPVPGFSRSATYSVKLYDSKGQLYSGRAKVQIPVTDGLGDCERYIGSVDGELFEVEAPVDGFFTVTVPHFSDVTISGYKAGDPATVNLKLYRGFSKTVLLDGWNYTEANIETAPDGSIATMLVNGNAGATETTVSSETTTALEDGASYIIRVYDTIYALTSNKGRGDWGTDTLAFEQNNLTAEEDCVWTLEASGSGYKLKCEAGYLNLGTGNNSGYINDTGEIFTLTYTATGWTVGNQSGRYINALGGLYTYYSAGGWTGDGTRFDLYKVTTKTSASTEVTFTGETVGTTTATVGHVTFNIEVLDVSSAVDGNIAGFTQIVGTKTYSDANGSVALSGKPITKLTIAAGSTFASLGVDIANADAVIWSSEDTGVATVDQNGSVTAVAEGETNISAKVIKDGIAETISIPVRVIPSLIPAGNTAALDESFSYVEAAHYVDVYFSLYGDHDYAQERKQAQTGEVVYFTRPINVAYGMVWMAAPQDAEKYALAYMAATGTEGQYYPLLSAGHDASEKCFCGSGAYTNLLTYYGATEDELNSMLAAALAAHCTGAMSQGRRRDRGVSEPMVTSLTFVAEKLPDVSKTLNGILPGGGKAPTFRRYTGERMTGEVGDYIYFTIAVIQEAPKVFDPARTDGNYSLVEYTQATLIDTVEQGAGDYYFYTKAQDTNYDGVIDEEDGSGYQQLKQIEIHDDLNTAWTAQEIAAGKRTKEYYVVYTIVDADLQLVLDSNGEPEDQIKNSVTFDYSFNSIYDYSKGSTAGAAAAAAETLVVGEYVGEFVVDFGLPLIITVEGAEGGFQYLRKENYVSCKYGTVEVTQTKGADSADFGDDEFTIVYTPTTILPTADEVLLFRTKSDADEDIVVNSFSVVPASSVYYAAGLKEKAESTKPLFFENTTGWSWESLVVGPAQNLDTLGDVDSEGKPIKTNPYGYDAVYATMSGLSHGTQLSATAKGAEAVFSFTGTGMEIFANCSATTGTVMVEIWTFDDNGDAVDDSELVWAYLVDTKADATYYGLPIVSVTDLEYDSYVVKLRKTQNDGTVNIDGFRILGTVEEDAGDSSLYFYDQEDHPDFYELRDFVLGGMGVQGLDNWRNWYSAVTGNQIFNQGAYASGAIVLDAASTQLGMDAETLLKYGPKNELFLWKGQSLTFKVTTDRLMQIGLKAPQGQTDVEVSVTYGGTPVSHKVPTSITSSVDMFYELGNENGTERTYTITITNEGTNVLSVTKLKICDDPDATFGTLTEEDVANVLVDQGLMPQRTDKDATVRVSLQDYAGNQVGAVILSKRGADGRRVTFTAAEVLAAARQQMPEGYDFVNKEAVFDVTATYGESREAYVQVGKVATVNITYISLSKRKVYTVTVTKIQFAEGDCRLSVTELMHYSPLGRFLLMMSGITAEYGAETDVVVTVL